MSTNSTIGASPIPVYREIPEASLCAVDESYTQLLNCGLKENTELRLSRHNKFYTVRVGATGVLGKCVEKIVNLFTKIRHEGLLRGGAPDKLPDLTDRLIEVFNAQAMLALGQNMGLRSLFPTIDRLNKDTGSFKLITNYLELNSKAAAGRVRKHINQLNEVDRNIKAIRYLLNLKKSARTAIIENIIDKTFNTQAVK